MTRPSNVTRSKESWRPSASQGCEVPNCGLDGLYRAPKSPRRLNEHYWFCLEHVRAYNRAWNYCEGMGETDIETAVRAATCWERPSWPLGQWYRQNFRQTLDDLNHAFERSPAGATQDGHGKEAGQASVSPIAVRALKTLGLMPPIAWPAVKKRYRELVKRLHPDANGGDKSAEERLKLVNQAYSTLRNRAWS